MALAKKGSRSILIDDVQYRWKARSETDGTTHVVVELYDEPQQSIVAFFQSYPFDDPEEKRVITPATVTALVNYALKQRWTPEKKAKQLNLGFLDDIIKE
ncbi:MAG TPA: hypothetical protein DCS93_20160 [Microscillaceae bacterium]|nr:hypothetical protein [Microscillaceae bacterium]